MDYNFKEVEKKWKKYWKDNETFKTDVWDFSTGVLVFSMSPVW